MSTLLLESFPAPPSFIPPSPRSPTPNTANPNPPPSRPPSTPLPPIPGPSRISESDTLLFLGSSRNSKYSAASRPDSIASVASARSNGAHYSQSPNNRHGRGDSSSSGFSSNSRFTTGTFGGPSPRHSPIRESYLEDADDASVFDPAEAYGGTASTDDEMEHSQEQLTKLRLSPMPPDNERDHEHDRSYSPPLSARFPQPPPLSLRDQGTLANKRLSLSSSISSGSSSKQPFVDKGPSTHQDISSIEAGDSISSISMHDLPSDDGSASEDDVLTTTNYPVPFRHRPPSLNLRSGKHLLASQHLLPSPLQTSGMTLSPQTPAISHTPPTPQSPAFGQPTSADATLPPSISRLKGRFSSTAGRPAHSTTVNIDLSGPSAPDTPIEPSTPATSSTMNAMPLTPSSQSTFVSPTPTYPTQLRPQSPPEATVEFPTQVQFPRSSDSPLDDIYTPTDDPLLLHRELRSARSRSASHKKRLNSSKPSTPVRSPTFPLEGENVEDETVAVLPRSRSSSNISVSVAERAAGRRAVTGPPPSAFRGPPPRAGSPDIEDLLESTPRPRRRGSSASRMSASTSVSSFGSTRSRSASRPRKGRKSGTSVKTLESRRRASEGQFRNRDESQFAELERELEGLGSDDELVGYAGRRERFGSGYDFEASRSLTASEDELIMEDDGSASDSSLDIHTPLPNLLLRDGVLSHKSRILPTNSISASDSVESLAISQDGQRPGSTMSLRSVDSKSSLLKDVRDTPVRRLRHKDGKTLRGGLGLTTGLGWSDSEDEDAPSPLTNRVTSLIVSRRSSFASLGNGRPSSTGQLSGSKSSGNLRTSSYSARSSSSPYTPGMLSKLSRSHSNTTLLETDEFEGSDEDGYASTTFHGYPTISRTAGLPTSSSPPTSWQHTPRFTNRSRVGSKGSKGSLAVSIPDQASVRTRSSTSTRGIARSASESSMRSQSQYTDTDEMLKTPSTSVSVSSLAIPPLTPKDYDEPLTPLSTMRGDKNKILPPLPNPKTGSIRRPAIPGLAARFASPNGPGLRSRSNSIGTSLSSSNSSPAVSDAPPLPTSTGIPVSSSTGTLRQLQLPRYSAGASQKPVPVPGVTSPTRSPIAPTAPSSLPKPRTGTGMAYRKSANPSNPRISRIPSSPMLRSPSGTRF